MMATTFLTEKSTEQSEVSACDRRVDAFLKRKQTWIAGAMCCFALIRILIFAAAFPLFNNVDEQFHYEMVYRFAHGYMPEKELPRIDPEMARVFTLYGTAEYFNSEQLLRSAHMDTPIAGLPAQTREVQYRPLYDYWTQQRDMEAQSPPAYYLLAAVWLRIGETLGMKDWTLAYWVRFMNAVVYAMFVWISFLFTKEVVPGKGISLRGGAHVLGSFSPGHFLRDESRYFIAVTDRASSVALVSDTEARGWFGLWTVRGSTSSWNLVSY